MSFDARANFREQLRAFGEDRLKGAITYARELGGTYFPQMADQLERFARGGEVEPIRVDSLDDIFTEIKDRVWGQRKITKIGRHTIPPDPERNFPGSEVIDVQTSATDHTMLEIDRYWKDVAQYLAFQPR